MRRFWRIIWWAMLLAGLVFSVVLFTLRWWVTDATNALLPTVLREAPLDEAVLSVEQLGLARSRVEIEQVRFSGLDLSDTTVDVDYAVEQLQRKGVDSVIVAHPHLNVDILQLLPKKQLTEPGNGGIKWPETIPLNQLRIDNATIDLSAGSWKRSLYSAVNVSFGVRTSFRLSAFGGGERFSLIGAGDATVGQGSFRGEFSLLSLANWLTLAKKLDLPLSPSLKGAEMSGDFTISGSVGQTAPESIHGQGTVKSLSATVAGYSFYADRLDAAISGRWPGSLIAQMSLEPATLNWANGSGAIEGLTGVLDVVSLKPIGVFEPQTLRFDLFKQGELKASNGRLTFSYDPNAKPALDIDIGASALSGDLLISMTGSPATPRSLEVRARFNAVSLAEMAALLPDFDGRIAGTVSGELAIRIEGDQIVLMPGYLEMAANDTGIFQFYKQGWITQDPKLNPAEYAKGKDIVKLLSEPNGATVLTELAMQNLVMTKFRLDVLKPDSSQKKVSVEIMGHSEVKGIEIPVVLSIPVSGDVIETLDLILKLQKKF